MKLIFLLFLLSFSILAEGEFPVMLKLTIKEKFEDKDLKTIRAGIEMGLTSKNYSLIDEKTQEEALKEQVKQQKSECYDDNCLVDVGRMMAARALFILDITKLSKDKYLFKVKFIDLETAETKKTIAEIYTHPLSDSQKLLNFSKKLTSSLLTKKIIIKKKITLELNTNNTRVRIISGKCKIENNNDKTIELIATKDEKCKLEITKPYFHKTVKEVEFNKEKNIKINLKELKKYKTKFILFPLNSKAKLVNVNNKNDIINIKSGEEIILYENEIYNLISKHKNYEDYSILINTNNLKNKYNITLYKPNTSFLKSYLVFDTTLTSYLKYMSIGVGTTIYSRENKNYIFTALNTSFYKNLTDNYYYIDIELGAFKYKFFKGFTTGVSISLLPIFAKEFIFTQTYNLDFEYKYNISKSLFVNLKLRTGLSSFKSTNEFKPFLNSGINIGYSGF